MSSHYLQECHFQKNTYFYVELWLQQLYYKKVDKEMYFEHNMRLTSHTCTCRYMYIIIGFYNIGLKMAKIIACLISSVLAYVQSTAKAS